MTIRCRVCGVETSVDPLGPLATTCPGCATDERAELPAEPPGVTPVITEADQDTLVVSLEWKF